MSHDYTRPAWDCGTCAREWPCSPAKVELAERYPDPMALWIHMLGLMALATGELPLSRCRPTELRNRFVEWTRITPPSPRPRR
jgi:hypothetical protein